MEEHELLRKLRAVESLYAGGATEGERAAAAEARQRIRQRLAEMQKIEPEKELQFSLPDEWSVKLLVALARRYGLEPFRYKRQRRTTVVIRAPRRFLDETLCPEFDQLWETLNGYLEEVTDRVIREGVHQDTSDAGSERREVR